LLFENFKDLEKFQSVVLLSMKIKRINIPTKLFIANFKIIIKRYECVQRDVSIRRS